MTSTWPFSEQTASEKSAMRLKNGRLRDALAVADRNAETTVCMEMLFALPAYQRAQRLLLTINFGSEMDTSAIIARARHDGKQIVLPRVDKASKDLLLLTDDGTARLEKSAWGLMEPALDSPPASPADIDFVLVPGLAFDLAGNRLGYGRGYYDRLLAQLPATTPRVAIAFGCQVVDAVPTTHTDQTIDALITANHTHYFSKQKAKQ